jgi:putative addiction module component (TIGR02574 family)
MNVLLDKALELPISERIKFVEDVWDSIAVETGAVELSVEQRTELDRRMKEYKEDPRGNIPWKEIKADALDRR